MTNNEIKFQIALGTLDIGKDLNPVIVKEIDDVDTVNMLAKHWSKTYYSSLAPFYDKILKELVNFVDIGTILLQHKFIDEHLMKVISNMIENIPFKNLREL